MAGDWLQIDLDLPEKWEVGAIIDAAQLCHADVALGRLLLLWRWVERHASTELVRGARLETLIRVAGGDETFWRAVESVGWVQFTDEGVVIPGWKKRFSKSAKQRALNSRRQKRRRAVVAQKRDKSNASASPKEEKNRREDIKGVNPLKPPGFDVGDLSIPESLDTADVREALADWIRYKRQRGQPYKTPKFLSDFLVGFIPDGPAGLVAAIRSSLGQNYHGIFRASEKPNGKSNNSLSAGRIYDPQAAGGDF